MAIAFNSAGQQYTGVSLTNSFSCTKTSGDFMFAGVVVTNTRTINTIPYNGVAGTLVTSELGNAFFDLYVYQWIAPATGSNTLSCTINNNGETYLFATSYTGAKQTGQPDGFSSNALSTGTSFTQSVTVTTANSWGWQLVIGDGGGLAASTGSTLRGSILNGAVGVFDTNSVLAAGSNSMSTTMSSGLRTGIIASFAPAATANSYSVVAAQGSYAVTGNNVSFITGGLWTPLSKNSSTYSTTSKSSSTWTVQPES